MLRSAAAAFARRHLSAASSSGAPPTRIAELVSARATDAPDALALVVPASNIRWTYGELVDRINCFASGLHEMGYAPGQRLGVRLDNSSELLVTLMSSALTGGAVVLPLPPPPPPPPLLSGGKMQREYCTCLRGNTQDNTHTHKHKQISIVKG